MELWGLREWHIQNQKIVVLGAGGAACAIIVEMALQGAKEIVVYNRSEKPFIKELNQKLNCDIHLKSLSNKDELKHNTRILSVDCIKNGATPRRIHGSNTSYEIGKFSFFNFKIVFFPVKNCKVHNADIH